MATVLCGISLCVLDGTVMNLALPAVARDMHVGASEVIWVVNAYQVAILALLLPLARLGDLYGYRKVYLSGLALFTLSSLACVLSRTLPWLSLARAFQGMGAAGMFAINAALVRAIYPRLQLGRGIALNSAVVGIASVAGPSVAALVLSVASWPWLFAINVPLGLAVWWLGRRSLPGHRAADAALATPTAADGRFSLPDAALNIAMFALLFVGLDRLVPRAAQAADPAAPLQGAALLAAGMALGAWYARRQWHEAVPLLPIDLLRIPVFRLSMCTSIAAFAAQMLASIALPFLLLRDLGRSPGDAGLVLTAWPIATVLVAPLAGRLIGRIPDGLLGGIGLIALGAGLLALALVPAQPSNLALAWRLALCGAGFGLFQSPNNHTIVTSAPAARSGAAGGMLGSARLTGQSLGAALLALLFSPAFAAHVRAPALALALAAACAAGASVASLLRLKATAPGQA
ncbi:MAG: MFS transporter [Burkholderiales bacterium]|nr:MFS transporter [Burkholderiales bacterium]